MRNVFALLICIALLILSGCSSGAPSNKDIKELIYGVYFKDAAIISKEVCEYSPRSENSALWLVYFIYKGDNRPYGYLIEISSDGTLSPFNMPISNATCPK